MLSGGEKLILAMLSEIYKHLEIKGEIDPDFVMDTVFSSHTWGLRWKYESLFDDQDDEQPPAVKETCDILDMFRILTPSYDELPDEDKARVKKEADLFAEDYKFQGFDGNNDDHYHIVGYLVNKLGRYTEVSKHNINSHSSMTLPGYRRMLSEFRKIKLGPKYRLDADQIIRVLKAEAA